MDGFDHGSAIAHPNGQDATHVEELLEVIQFGRLVLSISRFLENFADRMEQQSDGLVQALQRCLVRHGSFERMWTSALTGINGTELDPSIDPLPVAIAAVLELQPDVDQPGWSVELVTPTSLRYGQFIFDGVTGVERQRGQGSKVTFHLASGGTASPDGLSGRKLGWIGGSQITLLDQSSVPLGCRLGHELHQGVARSIDPAFASDLEDAVLVLTEQSPIWAQWVTRVIRDVICVDGAPGVMLSGSNPVWPGVVYLSRANVLAIAENLVHEAAHQYFYLVHSCMPMTEPGSDGMYYSPFRERQRPLESIVLAFHAFGNARLFLETVGGLDASLQPWLTHRIAELDAKLEVAASELRRGRLELTPTGTGLTVALAEALSVDLAFSRTPQAP